jgi:phosphoglycolate phosphatase-like HAD superfamily hydrolase
MLPASDLAFLVTALAGRLETVLFDLDGTLRHNHPSPTQALFDRATAMGVPDGSEKRRMVARWTHYYWAQSPELFEDRSAFPEPPDFWINYTIRSLLAFDCTLRCASELAPELTRYMSEEYCAENVIPPDVRHTLGCLKEAGYRLALLSNREQPCHAQL